MVSTRMEGSRYAIELEMLGTNTGASGGLRATGKPYRIRAASIGGVGPRPEDHRESGLPDRCRIPDGDRSAAAASGLELLRNAAGGGEDGPVGL
jgi:hypothetical protein